MDPLSEAASALACVSVAIQLVESCMKLYYFWESVRDAPEDVKIIMEDLEYLSTVVRDIARDKSGMAPSVAVGLKCCQSKIRELNGIVESFDEGFRSHSRKLRLWTAFKASTRTRQLQKFRDSLNDTKSTLMLALMYQSIQRPDKSTISETVENFDEEPPPYTDPEEHVKKVLKKSTEKAAFRAEPSAKEKHVVTVPPDASKHSSLTSNKVMKQIVQNSVEQALGQLIDSGTVRELVSKAISQVTSFESKSSGAFSTDTFDMKEAQSAQDSPPPYTSESGAETPPNEDASTSTKSSPSRVCHRVSSYGSAFGCVWVRTTTLHLEARSKADKGNFHTITSFIFYPASWLKRIGVNKGVEASMVDTQDGWQFHFNPVRAVPESSPIFELCRSGETRSVELLISKDYASVLDTSPKGWTPLHYAAAGGHVDLCASLIRLGADKSSLAYEGPASNVLSPIALFATLCGSRPAESKIRMLRLFEDCLDITEPEADGWIVHGELKRTSNKENVPPSQNAITWLMRATASEPYVTFGSKTIWTAAQSAVRSFLIQERDGRVLEKLLGLPDDLPRVISASHLSAFAHWLALRAAGRELLPMVLDAGRFCQIHGFDWVEDDITPSQFIKALPVIYAAWSVAMPNGVDHVGQLVRMELEYCLDRLGWSKTSLLEHFSSSFNTADKSRSSLDGVGSTCTECADDYGDGHGLVQPARIRFTECVKTKHRLNCVCSGYIHDVSFAVESPTTPGYSIQDDSDAETDIDEFFDAEANFNGTSDALPTSVEVPSDPFIDAATQLYRAQGRNWLGKYRSDEMLCARCFLHRETYIGEDGLGTEDDFAPMPESFAMYRADVRDVTVEVMSN